MNLTILSLRIAPWTAWDSAAWSPHSQKLIAFPEGPDSLWWGIPLRGVIKQGQSGYWFFLPHSISFNGIPFTLKTFSDVCRGLWWKGESGGERGRWRDLFKLTSLYVQIKSNQNIVCTVAKARWLIMHTTSSLYSWLLGFPTFIPQLGF